MSTEQKASKKARRKGVVTKARRKTAIAHATLRKGTGRIRVNRMLLEIIQPRYVQLLIKEPITLAGDLANDIDVDVSVKGSGQMAQAVAARGAIAKALVSYTNSPKLKKEFLDYNRMLIVDDIRQTEPKKPLGKGARAKKQKSKR
ncbi:MAG: 30S ribosomal protein S9 [Candidatus Diapherotrites archaeon]|uniref:30S ribosomal protein S9 n=1 Tax=Candidatus Iainarchaeum sp. TaxID=3101447 RepID=A0A8T4KR41_9ARCH|nr:30S ribosomal protein S9 [Candidatus Diapherotrites archaeon]